MEQFYKDIKSHYDMYIGLGAATLASGIIGGATSLLGGIGANAANSEEAKKNRQFQREERIAAQDWNKEMWDLQNEYNTPEAQMQRMIEAGINPAAAAQAITGGQNTAGSVAASQPSSGSQAATMTNPAAHLGEVLAGSVGTAWQNYLVKNQAKTEEAKKDNIEQETKNKEQEFKWNEATWEQRQNEIDTRINTMVKDGKLKDEQAKQIREMLPLLKDKTQEEINMMIEQTNKLKIEYDQIEADIKKVEQDIRESMSREELNYSEIKQNEFENSKLVSDTALNYQNMAESDTRMALNNSQAALNYDQIESNSVERQLKYSQMMLNDLKRKREMVALQAEQVAGVPAGSSLGFTVKHAFANGDFMELLGLAAFFIPGGGTAKAAGTVVKGIGKGAKWIGKGAKTGWKTFKGSNFGRRVYSKFGQYGTPDYGGMYF